MILIFRGVHGLGASVGTLRWAAWSVAALVVGTTMLVTLRLTRRRIAAVTAGLLAATVGASPFIESFTLSGELLSSLPALASLLAFCAYLRSGRRSWLLAAGLATGCAVMIKQSGFDAGLAAAAFLVLRQRRRALLPLALLVGSALVPVAIGAFAAANLHAWWYAVVAYRGHGDSLLTGSLSGRLQQLWSSLGPAAKGLGLLALLSCAGWRRSPLLARLWLGAALLGVLGGGNFHPHYYVQLVPPLSLLGAIGLLRLLEARRRGALVGAGVALAVTAAFTLPLWFASPTAQARTIWPHDPHLQHDAAVARYVRAGTGRADEILVLYGAADLYYLTNRAPAIPYLWSRNIQVVPGALAAIRQALARRTPALVIASQSPGKVEPELAANYRLAARVDGVPVYRRIVKAKKTSAARSEKAAQ